MVHYALRSGFRRYLMAVQYHGSSFLGFSLQHTHAENCILPNGTDLRGYVSVERRIRLALSAMLDDNDTSSTHSTVTKSTESRYENIQVSSRTDSGVHAIKNTFHVDVRIDDDKNNNNHDIDVLDDHEGNRRRRKHTLQCTDRILRGINFYLRRTNPTSATSIMDEDVAEDRMCYQSNDGDDSQKLDRALIKSESKRINRRNTQYYCAGEWIRRCPAEEIRILAVKEAPLYMKNTVGYEMYNQNLIIDWNARYSALSRTYIYRIMHCVQEPDWGIPFEWDRSWRIYDHQYLNIDAMRIAASYLIGTNDYSSFRAAGCQRNTPIMTLSDITIHVEPYDSYQRMLYFGGLPSSSVKTNSDGNNVLDERSDTDICNCHIVTIRYQGDSFLYRQVRKMTACLTEVGRGKIQPSTVRDILQGRNSGYAPYTAPPQGLYLVDVEHEGIRI
jgi:tRNA U38,U39,U40 pseudouridine synthase TruA